MNPYPPNQAPNPYEQNPYQAPGPAAQNPYAPPGYASPGGYEFSEAENKIIGAAATWTMILAVVFFVQAIAALVGKNVIGALLDIVMGALTISASTAFRKVVKTQGQDVPHLMSALGKFSSILLIRSVLFIIAAVIVLVVIAFVFLLVGATMSRH